MGWKAVLAILFFALAAQPADEEAAIRQVLSRQQEAWNRGDIPGFMAGYEDSPDTTFVGKDVTRGYQPVLERYVKRYPTRETMGKLTFSEVEIHVIGNSHAWALGRFSLERTVSGGGNASGRFTLVFKKTKPGWKIVLDHTS